MNRIISGGVAKAIYDDDIDALKRLIKIGKRIDIQDNLGWTPLHAAVSKNRIDMVEVLCQSSECPINSKCYEGQTPLFLACERNCNYRIVEVLLSSGADPNITSNEESSPLHQATGIETVEALIASGASVNTQDLNGYTPLHCAIERQKITVAKLLLNAGADINICECNGLNALMLSLSKSHVETDELELLLAENVRDVNAVAEDNWSALMLATNSGNVDVVKELLKRGADPNISADGLTPLHLAIMRQDVTLWKLFWRPNLTEDVHSSYHTILQSMLIHRWFVPERLECFIEALKSPRLHHTEHSFLNFLFSTHIDNKLQPEISRVVSTVMTMDKFFNRSYHKEIITLLENICPTELKQQILQILHDNGVNIASTCVIIVASEFEPDLVPYMLPFATQIRPLQLWDALVRSQRRDVSSLRLALHTLRLCTPTWRTRHRYLQKLPTPSEIDSQQSIRYVIRTTTVEANRSRRIELMLDDRKRKEMIQLIEVITVALNASSFPTLKELARDVIRSKRTSIQNAPQHVIDIIELRRPINIIPHL